jgi:hypothetical protein
VIRSRASGTWVRLRPKVSVCESSRLRASYRV